MSTKTNIKNNGFYIFIFVVSLGYLISALSLGKPVINSRLTPSFFPIAIGTVSVIISLLVLIAAIKPKLSETAKQISGSTDSRNSKEGYLALITIAVTAAYVLLFQTAGFFISSIPYVFANMLIFSNTEKLVSKFIYSVCITLFGYLLFAEIFNVRLPTLLG